MTHPTDRPHPTPTTVAATRPDPPGVLPRERPPASRTCSAPRSPDPLGALVSSAPLAARPVPHAVRLRPAPQLEPPVDRTAPPRPGRRPDPCPGGWAAPLLLPSAPAAPVLRLGTPPDEDPEFGPRITSRADLPDPGRHARNLVTAACEAMAGRRALQQLRPLVSEAAYERLSCRLARSLRSRPAAGGGPGPRARISVGSPVVCEPADGVAEVSVTVRWADRAHGVAVRLEGVDGRWHCTALDIL